jgi:hypothetical protein
MQACLQMFAENLSNAGPLMAPTIYKDTWTRTEIVMHQAAQLVTASSPSRDWEAQTGIIEGDKIRIFGKNGTLKESAIKWENGAVWTKQSQPTAFHLFPRVGKQEDDVWLLPSACPEGWCNEELRLPPPGTRNCFAALLHGDRPEYLAYASVLGHRLREFSPGPDRVLLCGPGAICADAATRASLRSAGWDYLLPVIMISAPYLDKSKTKRHAAVFTKFHAFCLPYERVLLLDVDLLPRRGTDLRELFAVAAPAGKYHCAIYAGPQPEHNKVIPKKLKFRKRWCPNAGVLRLNPLPTLAGRVRQLVQMVQEMNDWDYPSFLPEQYFLAEFFHLWHHIGHNWNYEVWFQWDVPKASSDVKGAAKESKQHGWSLHTFSEGDQVRREALVWHFSGMSDTQPWMFLDIPSAEEVRKFASEVWFAARDPSGVLAAAVAEWRQALDELLSSKPSGGELCALREAVEILASQTAMRRQRRFKDSPCWCDACGEERCNVEPVCPDLSAALGEPLLVSACAECLVWRLRLADLFSEPYSNSNVGKELGWAPKVLAWADSAGRKDGSSLAGKLRVAPYGARRRLNKGVRKSDAE